MFVLKHIYKLFGFSGFPLDIYIYIYIKRGYGTLLLRIIHHFLLVGWIKASEHTQHQILFRYRRGSSSFRDCCLNVSKKISKRKNSTF